MFEDEIVIENVEENNTEIREKWLIEIINDKPRSYIDMKYVNPNITYFENSIEVDKSEIDINNLKIYKLKDNKLVICNELNEIENERIKNIKIENIKKILTELKVKYSEKEFIFKDIYVQRNRELDKNNLNNIVTGMLVTKKTSFDDWKFKDLQGNDIYVTLTMQDILEMYTIMTSQTTKAMHIETDLRDRLNTMSIKELDNFNPKEEFEKLWNN